MTKTRLFLTLLGLTAIAALIWFAGPLLRSGEQAPLDGEGLRIALIVALFAAWIAVLAWRVFAARRADRRLVEGIGAASVESADMPDAEDGTIVRSLREADLLAERFGVAMRMLRRSGRRGAGRLSELPWYVLIGPPGAGKTTALQNSGLHFPLADTGGDAVLRGVGGTRHCDWWFADEAVLIDTAGRYTTQDSHAAVDGSAWGAFLALLRRHRRRRPINGIIVAISLDDLLDPDAALREAQARAIRQRIAELDGALGLRFPVYLLLTKADRLAGFAEFFAGLTRSERGQVWGMSFATDEAEPLARFASEYDALLARLNDRMLARLAQETDAAQRALLFGFPCQVATLKDDIAAFLASVFRSTRYEDASWLRGVYLTSSTQATQATQATQVPLPPAAAVAPRAGVAPVAVAPAVAGPSYFLADLLQRVIFPERELVGFDRRLERRRVWLHGLSYAVAGLCMALGACLWADAYARGKSAIGQMEQRLSATALQPAQAPGPTATWVDVLAYLDRLRDLPGDAASPRDRGLRQAGALGEAARRTYLREMNRLLAPRIAAAVAQTLRDARREPEPTYAALKGYLMLGQPEHRDAAYLKALLQWQWEHDLPRQADAVARLQGHFDALVAGGMAPVALDADLVREARAVLDRVPLAQLAYSRLKREALAHDDQPFVLRQALGPTGAPAFERNGGQPVDQRIAGLYTARGYGETFLPQSRRLTQSLRADAWVIGNARGELDAREVASLGDDVADLYANDYIQAWKDLLADLKIASFRTPAQAMDALAGLSGRKSALRSLLLAVDANTRLKSAGDAGVDARLGAKVTTGYKQAKAELTQLLATDAPARKPTAVAAAAADLRPGARIEAAFADLAALVQPDKEGHAPIDAVIERLAALYTELGTLQSQDLADPARHADSPAGRGVMQIALAQPAPVKDWLLQLASGSVQLTDAQQEAALKKKRGEDGKALLTKIDAAWKSDVLPYCTTAVAHRYPVDRRSASDIPLQDFARLFGPGGLIDAFVKDNLRPYIDASSSPWRWRRSAEQIDLGAAPQALRQLEIAAAARDEFFHVAGPQPSVDFTLRALPVGQAGGQPGGQTGVPAVALTQGDQHWVDRAAPARLRPVRWPASDGGQTISLSVGDSGSTVETRSAEGPWALFRLLDQATLERTAPDRVVATFRLPTRSAQLELRASSVINPFRANRLDQFECPRGFQP